MVFFPAVSDPAETTKLHDVLTDLLFILYYLKLLLGYEIAQVPKATPIRGKRRPFRDHNVRPQGDVQSRWLGCSRDSKKNLTGHEAALYISVLHRGHTFGMPPPRLKPLCRTLPALTRNLIYAVFRSGGTLRAYLILRKMLTFRTSMALMARVLSSAVVHRVTFALRLTLALMLGRRHTCFEP